jgi:hypothetical protein
LITVTPPHEGGGQPTDGAVSGLTFAAYSGGGGGSGGGFTIRSAGKFTIKSNAKFTIR